MSCVSNGKNRRILIIDDNEAIHDDFRKILGAGENDAAELDETEAALFGDASATTEMEGFEIDSAHQGQEGLTQVCQAIEAGRPFAMAFVDVRMPPGWDGIETAARIWREDPDLQIVICTAYSDYAWDEMIEKLGQADRWMILKKPFDNIEVRQLAFALTEKWNLAQAARKKLEDLEQAVRQRTQELEEQKNYLEEALARLQEAHAQLLQADKMASIGQLAAGVAHEINNPIGFISSNLNSLAEYAEDLKQVLQAHDELLRECQQADPKVAAKAEEVRKVREAADMDYIISDLGNLIEESVEGTQRVRRIVSDLRDFSHVDAPDVSEEDINELLDKTINVAWNELKYKTEVIREYGQLPVIPCYGGKLGQVFLNLLVNAAHAIKEHGTITVRTGHEDNNVWIEVADTGCGIPPKNLKRIFDPFFTTKEVGKGTGMGLHLAYKIVEAHGGRISTESTVGKGTTFRVELPLTGPPEAKETRNESVA